MTSFEDSYRIAVEKANFNGRYTADSVVVTLSLAIGLYNSLEMYLLIYTTFKRYTGLYFWSLVICTFSVILYCVGILLTYFDLGNKVFARIILDIGWIVMIVTQSLVLYSRLGLVVSNEKILKGVKWMIIFNSTVLGSIVITLDLGLFFSHLPVFARAYFYIEHIQMTVYTVQEVLISGLYVWKTIALLDVISGEKSRKIIWQLMVINILIIGMDICLIVLQFKHLQLYQESIKGFVYSVKLKLELNILSKLVDFVHGSTSERAMTLEVIDSTALSGQSQADIQEEMAESKRIDTWLNDDKSPSNQVVNTRVAESSSSSADPKSPPNIGTRDFSRTFSHVSRYSARTAGRESDIEYADALRSMA